MDEHSADLIRRIRSGGNALAHLEAWAQDYQFDASQTDYIEGTDDVSRLTPLTVAEETQLQSDTTSTDANVRANAQRLIASAVESGRHSTSTPGSRKTNAERLAAAKTVEQARIDGENLTVAERNNPLVVGRGRQAYPPPGSRADLAAQRAAEKAADAKARREE